MSRLRANTLWSLLGFAVPTLVTLGSTPVYLHFLGDRAFGLWTLCIAVLAFAGVLNLTLGESATALVAGASAQDPLGRPAELTRIVLASTAVFGALAVLAALGLATVARPLAEGLLGLSGPDADEATHVLRIASAGVVPMVLQTVTGGVFEGLQRFRVSQLLAMGRSVATFGLGWALLASGSGLPTLVSVTVLVTWGVALVGFGVLGRELVLLSASEWAFRATSRRLLAFGMYSTATSVGTLAVGQLDKVIIGALLGLESVGTYGLAQALASKVHLFAIAAGRALMPYFAAGDATGDLERVEAAWRRSLALTAGVVTLAGAAAPTFLRAWIGPARADASLGVFAWLLASYGLHGVNVVPYYYLTGRSRPGVVAASTLVGGGLMLILLITLTPVGQLHGVGVASLFYPLGCLLLAWNAARLASPGGSPWPLLRRMSQGLPMLLVVHGVVGLGAWFGAALTVRLGLGNAVATGVAGVLVIGGVLACRAVLGERAGSYFDAHGGILRRLRRGMG